MNNINALHYIDGQWVKGDDCELVQSFDPATGDVIGHYVTGSVELTNQAIAAARHAFEHTLWSSSPRLREQALLALADAIEREKNDLISLIMTENGKLKGEATFEVLTSVSECRFYAGLARTQFGRTLESEPDTFSLLNVEAAGVAAVIVPWNAPVILMIRSLAPALAAGCTAVIKPAPQTPLSHNWVLQKMAEITIIPAGVINSVNENGAVVGKRLVESADVDVISFTGSSATGKAIMSAASNTLKRLSLELGGKAPAVIFDDADMHKTVEEVVKWSLVMSGQMCIAITRILVQSSSYEQYKSALIEAYKNIKVGPSRDPSNQMGPLIDKQNQKRVLDLISRAKAEETVLLEGSIVESHTEGCFVSPTLIEPKDLDSYFVQEEIFGPIICLESFDDEAEAIKRANATRYGLAASVWTNDLTRAMRVSKRLKSGTVWINSHGRLIAEAETGGYGESGLGRLHGVEALRDFTETKHVYIPSGESA